MYFEDIEVGSAITVGTYRVEADEIIDFARRWDPLPVHTSEVDARATSFGGLTASGAHTMAIRTRLTHLVPIQESVIAAAGWDEVRFHRPLRPGDELSLEVAWLDKRRSRTKPDRGIVTAGMRVVNQHDEVILSHRDTIVLKLRVPGTPVS